MAEKARERLRHTVLALLLSAGLAIPLAGALDESLISLRMLYVIGGTVLAFELVSFHRISAWSAAVLAAAGAAAWVFTGDGARMLSDAGIAVSLRIKGIGTAVPLAAQPLSIIIAAGTAVLCCFAVLRRMNCIPSIMLCTAVAMAVWLTDSMQMLPYLLPALAAVLTLLMTYRCEGTPALHVLPWAAALTALAFLLTGSGPAENPLKEKADEIRQSILDRLFFTEARDVFSLYSVGLSPQGADQLGGKPNLSETPVMQVSAPRTAYLRGTVYNRYNGHGWQNTTGGRRYLWQSGLMADTREELFDETLPPDSVQNPLSNPSTVSVRMLSDSASTLFVPQRIRELNPGGETVPYFSNSSEIFITRNLQAGDTWEVSAPLYTSEDPGIGTLTEICAALEDPRWETVRETYTELPAHLQQEVRDIAEKAASGCTTPYQKARALQEYLKRYFKYTLDVSEHPANIDFVTSFLLDTKRGYCTYFASAMTVLCRMEGLPARYVEGYLAVPDENGEAVVTGMDAHAWTEVYFSGFGWLTFDATPAHHSSGPQNPQSIPTPTPEPTPTPTPEPAPAETPTPEAENPEPSETPEGDNSLTPEPEEIPKEEPSTRPSEAPSDKPENPPELPKKDPALPHPFPWWWLLLLLPAAAALRMLATSPSFRAKRAGTEEKRFDIWAEETGEMLRAQQLERKNGETLTAFAQRVDHTGPFSESITPAAECLSVIRYSRRRPMESDTGLMRDTALLLRSEMAKKAKARYLFRRFFRSGKKRSGKRGKA